MTNASIPAYLQTLAHDLGVLLPEGLMALGACALLIVELLQKHKNSRLKTLVSLSLLALIGAAVSTTKTGVYFDGLCRITPLTIHAKYLFLAVMGIVLLYPTGKTLRQKGEYHFLLFMILLGSFLLVQVQNLLLFYLALELVSISAYVLTTFHFSSKGFEAGIKYLLFGAAASALTLYGISLLYGLLGSLNLSSLSSLATSSTTHALWFSLAFLLFLVGILFKLSLAPFHLWSPDAYEAGPTPVVAYLSIVPKVAALLFFATFVEYLTARHWLGTDWREVLAIIAIVSLFVGNLSALSQKNAQRMMAYSSIAHAGMLIIPLMLSHDGAQQALWFYVCVYAVMNLAAFYFIDIMNNNGIKDLPTLAGLGGQYPWLGISITCVMVALVGLPPTGGFTAKLLIFIALWQDYVEQGKSYLLALFLVGIINAAFALFYYLKIPYYLWVAQPATEQKKLTHSAKDAILLTLFALLLLAFFFKADVWL